MRILSKTQTVREKENFLITAISLRPRTIARTKEIFFVDKTNSRIFNQMLSLLGMPIFKMGESSVFLSKLYFVIEI